MGGELLSELGEEVALIDVDLDVDWGFDGVEFWRENVRAVEIGHDLFDQVKELRVGWVVLGGNQLIHILDDFAEDLAKVQFLVRVHVRVKVNHVFRNVRLLFNHHKRVRTLLQDFVQQQLPFQAERLSYQPPAHLHQLGLSLVENVE